MFPLMGGGFDDLIGNHMQRMNNMMSSFFGNPYGADQFGNAGIQSRSRSMSLMPFDNDANGMLSPFGFPNMNQMMRTMNQVPSNPNCHSFSSSSVMSVTTGPDGKPQVYQASQSTRQGPHGVRETKNTLCDSRSGVKKMSIGHHIGERGHVKEKEQNLYTGQIEENDEFINLEEEEEPQFTNEWRHKAQQHYRPHSAHQAIGYHQQPSSRHENTEYLALPPSSRYSSRWYLTKTPSIYTSKYPRSLYPSRHKRLPNTRSRAVSDGNHLKEESNQKKKNHRSKPYDKRQEKKEKTEKKHQQEK